MNKIKFVLFVCKQAVKAIVLGFNHKVKVSITVDGEIV